MNLAQIFQDKDFEQNYEVGKNTGLTKFQITLKIQSFLNRTRQKSYILVIKKTKSIPYLIHVK